MRDLTLDASLDLLAARGALAAAVARGGEITHTSPKLDELFGFEPGGAIGRPLTALCVRSDHQRLAKALSAAAEPGEPGYLTVCFDAQRANGSTFEAEMLVAVGPVAGEVATVMLVSDITDRRRAEKQLSYMAFLDTLTGLANRALFLDRLRETLIAARLDGRVFAVMMCDLDGFKAVNDTLGHDAGDNVLQIVAQRLTAAVRESDTVARLGGDEFAILLAKVARRGDVALVASRVVAALEEAVMVGGAPCKLGISVGIAVFPGNGDDIDTLLGRADGAMYESKRAGKNRFTLAERDTPSGVHQLDFFQWGEAHAVGVTTIDAQHRALVNLLNQLGGHLKAGHARDTIVASLRELYAFTRKHFATEERLMADCPGWPGEEEHRQQHQKLLADLASLTVHAEEKSMMLTVRFLREWLLRHIEEMDKPLGAWLEEHVAA